MKQDLFAKCFNIFQGKKNAIKVLTFNANMDKFIKKENWFCSTNLVGM